MSRKLEITKIIAGAVSMTAMGLGILPAILLGRGSAIASELPSWNYDEQTRSLTLTLPTSVIPTISVTAPNQMLVELPDTQIGDVAGQNIGDGLVESIVLEQTTPDKVWMVVEFVPGTVLETEQSAVQLEGSTANDPLATDASLQQWQVRPALIAGGRPTNGSVNAAIESDVVAAPSALSPDAASLQESSVASFPGRDDAISQTPSFPDLPILEPAMPINAPVSVPPIDARPVPAQPTQSVPVQAAPMQIDVPVVAAPEPTEVERSVADIPASELPLEPPFIGERDEEIDIPVVDEPAPDEPAVIASPLAAPLSPQVTSEDESEDIADDGFDVELATAASADTVIPETLIPEINIPVENANTPPTNRWPEPIPFGQPLP